MWQRHPDITYLGIKGCKMIQTNMYKENSLKYEVVLARKGKLVSI